MLHRAQVSHGPGNESTHKIQNKSQTFYHSLNCEPEKHYQKDTIVDTYVTNAYWLRITTGWKQKHICNEVIRR